MLNCEGRREIKVEKWREIKEKKIKEIWFTSFCLDRLLE